MASAALPPSRAQTTAMTARAPGRTLPRIVVMD
jgi:hypothetical protein